MRPSGKPIWTAIKNRGYAAQAAARSQQASLPAQQPKVTRLPSGTVVASLENNSPVARLGIFYNAGPRSETGDFVGASHALRNASNLSTQNKSAFGITKNIQQLGGSLTCSNSREHTMYTLECLRDNADSSLEFLVEVATRPAFKPWEMAEIAARTKLDLQVLAQEPVVQLHEALHAAAYRGLGLGRSLYMPANRLGSHSPDMLNAFIQQNFTSANMAIIGTGMEHDHLLFQVKKIQGAQGAGSTSAAAKYYGGEVRVDCPGDLTHAAIVTQGADLGSSDLLTLGVLQKVMGSGPYIKWGSNLATSKVSKAASAGTTAPYAASCINASYSDNGLFGFEVVAQADDMANVLKSLVATFSSATKDGITDADVQRAKTQLRGAIAMELESGGSMFEDIGVQALLSGNILTLPDVDAAVQKITLADVQNVAKKVINGGKPSMAAVGNLRNTPFLDELL